MVPEEAWDLWEQGAQLLESEPTPARNLLNATSFFLEAIAASPVPFSEAHAMLALVYRKLKNTNEAIRHANLALQNDPHNYIAQSVKVFIAITDLKAFNPKPLTKTESWWDWLIALFAFKTTSDTQENLRKEIEKLLDIFSILSSQQDYTCKDYLWMGNEIMAIADAIPAKKTGLGDIVKKMYVSVGNVNVEALLFEDQSEKLEAKRLNTLARGRTRS